MFFDIEKEMDERRYMLLMFALQVSEGKSWVTVRSYRALAEETLGSRVTLDEVDSLWYLNLIRVFPEDGSPQIDREMKDDLAIEITSMGVAVLVNSAPRHLDKVITTYEVPDGTASVLVPLLDVRRVPAADRYVSTADNQELFADLATELENIRGELERDQNKNDLPIPVQEKRGMVAELDGLIGQIKAGYVRLSDLTQRARPLVKNIADTCKDIGVIGGMAYAAYEIIGKILTQIF